jgi:ubiquitin conjugation factor E4 B
MFTHPLLTLTVLHRRNISYILKVVWNNPTHREALNIEAQYVSFHVLPLTSVSMFIGTLTNLSVSSIS